MEENLRIKKSKLALKQALLNLMKKKSFNKITIKELCELAQLNRSTFYANYEDINKLLLEVHTDIFLNMSEVLGESWKTPHEISYEERVGSLIRIINYLEKNKDTFQLLLSNNDENLFEKNLTDYYMNLYITKNASYMDRYIFLYHSIGSFSLIYQWMGDRSPCPIKELAELICTMSGSARAHIKMHTQNK